MAHLLLFAGAALAARFTVTERILSEDYTVTEGGRPLTGISVNTISLLPSATLPPSATPQSSATYTDGYDYDNDVAGVATVSLYYRPGVLPSSAYTTVSDPYPFQSASATTTYVQTVAYVAPTECASQFTAVTTSTFSLPDQVTDQLTIEATSAFTSINAAGYYGRPTTTVFATLASTITPSGQALSSDAYYVEYVQSCYSFTVYPQASASPTSRFGGSGGGGGGGGSGGDNGARPDNATTCNSAWHDCGSGPKYWGIIVAAVLPAVFLLGFVESLLWYQRLMTGKSALRFGTVCWILLCPPFIFLTRRVPSRSEDDQQMLREQWTAKGFKRWSDWPDIQFRHRYPVEELGMHPAYDCESEDKVMTAYYDGGRAYTRPNAYAHGRGSNAPGIPALPPRPRQSLPSVPEEVAMSGAAAAEPGSARHGSALDNGTTEPHRPAPEAQPGPASAEAGPAPKESDQVSDLSTDQPADNGKH